MGDGIQHSECGKMLDDVLFTITSITRITSLELSFGGHLGRVVA